VAQTNCTYVRVPGRNHWHIYLSDDQGRAPAALCGYQGPMYGHQATPPRPIIWVCPACRDRAAPDIQATWRPTQAGY
jgi:hypothetical protein